MENQRLEYLLQRFYSSMRFRLNGDIPETHQWKTEGEINFRPSGRGLFFLDFMFVNSEQALCVCSPLPFLLLFAGVL